MLDPIWIFLLLALVSASAVVAGLFGGKAPKVAASRGGSASRTLSGNELVQDRETAYAAQRGF